MKCRKDYFISFDTEEIPGALKAVTVHLDTEIVRDLERKMPINLCEDPLYPALERYVLANPSSKFMGDSE